MVADHKGEVPALIYLLPFITGIIAGITFHFGLLSVTVITAVLSSAFIILNLFYLQFQIYRFTWVGGTLIHLILFFLGALAAPFNDTRNQPNYFANQPADHLLITIRSEPVLKNKYYHCTAQVNAVFNKKQSHAATGKLLLTVLADSLHHLQYGDQLLITAGNKNVDPLRNPAVFNYKRYLANQQIYEQSFLYPAQYLITEHNDGNPLIAFALRLRQSMVQKLKANITDTTAAAVASTLILGYKADLSQDVLQSYSKTGTIHVLSVSGAHVAIVFVFISLMLGFLNGSRSGQWFKAITIILLIWAYAMLTGFSPAVCRAALMLSFAIIGTAGYQYNNAINLLAVSAFILLIYDPLLITDVGFQLSYLAVFGLIVLQPIINKWLNFKHRYMQRLWYLISASIAAQVITFPLSIFYFHQFPVYFLISNLLIILPSEFILGAGLIAILLPQIPYVSKWLFIALEKSIVLMNAGLKLIEQQPYASINKIWFSQTVCMLLFIMTIALFGFFYSKKMISLWISLGCLLVVSISITLQQISSGNAKSIVFYSLNKHPGILFKNGYNAILLTDLRPTDAAFNYDMQPCIDSNHIENLTIAKTDTSLKTSYLQMQSGLVKFADKSLLILDQRTAYINLKEKIKVDYLYLTGNPHLSLKAANKNFSYSKLIVDGTNSPQNIKKLVNEADSLKINYTVLRRNNSLIMVSN